MRTCLRCWFLVASILVAGACTPAAPTSAPPVVPTTAEPEAVAPAPPALAPLSPQEVKLARQLQRDVVALSAEIGERSAAEQWNLATAADHVAREFEAAGYEVGRQGYTPAPELVVQNLEVERPGAKTSHEIVVVGAHYDSPRGSPGADANATGVAALLALARELATFESGRTLRLVAFATHAEPFWRNDQMGSLVYARRTAGREERVVAMLSLDSLGHYSLDAGSQRPLPGCAACAGAAGDFVAVLGGESARSLTGQVLDRLTRSASLPVRGGVVTGDGADLLTSDHWAFAQMGFPAVVVTDTGALRSEHAGVATDTADRVDFERLARAVAGVESVVRELCGG